MPEVDVKIRTIQKRYAVYFAILIVALVFAVSMAVDAFTSTTAHTQVITGKFMGLSADGGSLALQPQGKTSGTSYAYSSDTMWISSTGVVHTNGPATCLQAADTGHKITIGVVWTKPQGYTPGTVLLAYVRC